jgi:pimeloyl-ACP methyl ester carboxylesterase
MRTTAWLRPSGVALLLLVVGIGCSRAPSASNGAVGVAAPSSDEVTVHAPDAFYIPPADAPDRAGVLLRAEPLHDATLPAGLRGWRVLYTTTVDDATPATAVATVFAPIDDSPVTHPVIAWAHGTTGLLQKCMPSLVSEPTLGIPALERIVAAGWVVVATDYSFAQKGGPHPYMIGEGEARAVLDSVRAAHQMPELALEDRAVVWGHSQGGHSALWTGIVAPKYAPDVRIAGVAAIAPAANMNDILLLNQAANKRLGPYVAMAYSQFYPDVMFEEALRPEARSAAQQMVNLCGFFPPEDAQRIAALTATFDGPALATATNRALAARLVQNTADRMIAAPVVVVQGLADVVVPPVATDTYVGRRCAAGQRLEYWTFAKRDHGTIVQAGTPLEEPLTAWTKARFSDVPPDATYKGCVRRSF